MLFTKLFNFLEVKTNLLSGLTVALAMVPEAIAFALIAHVSPLTGLYAAIIICLITSVFGGRPGMISGATGALAVVMVALVVEHGVEYLFATVILMGILQIVFAIFRLGKYIRMVPYSVMLGFVNGLAIVIFIAQFGHFKIIDSNGISIWMSGMPLFIMLILTGITVLIIYIFPLVTKAIPSTLASILIVTLIVLVLGVDTKTVGDLGSISGGIPEFKIPNIEFNLDSLRIILPYSFLLASIGLIETLLTLNLIDDMTDTNGKPNKESMAQGIGNIITGFFGGMGGCAMIGQSMINVNSGGRTRISGISAAIFLLIFILYGSKLIEQIPLAVLVGVMFMVVIGTFAWNSLRLLFIVPRADALVILLVTFVTVMEDLAIAVIVGVIVSALVYAWNAASRIHATARPSITEIGALVYEIEGPLFFGSATSFMELFEPKKDPDIVILDFKKSRVVDQSALQAIEAVAEKYQKLQKRVMLRHLSADCHRLLNKSGQLTVKQNDDPDYELAVDYDIQLGRFASNH